MSKYYGNVGYVEHIEAKPGMWIEQIIERPYFGDVDRDISHWQPTENLADDVKLNNQISIVADPYALDNYYNIRYVTFNNSKWKVSAVTLAYPRIVLNMGGLYHEQTTATSEDIREYRSE